MPDRLLAALFTSLFSPHLFRFRAVFHHVFTTGISAVPIVALIAIMLAGRSGSAFAAEIGLIRMRGKPRPSGRGE